MKPLSKYLGRMNALLIRWQRSAIEGLSRFTERSLRLYRRTEELVVEFLDHLRLLFWNLFKILLIYASISAIFVLLYVWSDNLWWFAGVVLWVILVSASMLSGVQPQGDAESPNGHRKSRGWYFFFRWGVRLVGAGAVLWVVWQFGIAPSIRNHPSIEEIIRRLQFWKATSAAVGQVSSTSDEFSREVVSPPSVDAPKPPGDEEGGITSQSSRSASVDPFSRDETLPSSASREPFSKPAVSALQPVGRMEESSADNGRLRLDSAIEGRGVVEPSPRSLPEENTIISFLVAPGSAEIYVDGHYWGTADSLPRVGRDIDTGLHKIQVRKSGYSTYSKEVDAVPGRPVHLSLNLVKLRSDLSDSDSDQVQSDTPSWLRDRSRVRHLHGTTVVIRYTSDKLSKAEDIKQRLKELGAAVQLEQVSRMRAGFHPKSIVYKSSAQDVGSTIQYIAQGIEQLHLRPSADMGDEVIVWL